MKLLVTGASGFVGSALLFRLSRDGEHQVRAAVRREVGNIPEGVTPVQVGELYSEIGWRSPVSGVDGVVHLAARVHVMRDSAADPLAEFRRVNVAGTLNLARQAAAAGVRRFVFISSIKVNGEGTSLGKSYAADDVPGPVDPYGISKLEAELGLREVAADTGMEVVIIRPPLVYGPQVKGNFLRLLQCVERGIPLPFVNVDNRRSLVNVRNLVDLIVRCIEHPVAAGETFLVSDGEDVSTGDLVRHVAAAMGRKPRLFPVPLSLTRSMLKVMGREDLWQRLFGSLQVSCDKARDLLGWRPPVSVAEGLEEIGRWYLESRNSR